jgi:hypothetical protein
LRAFFLALRTQVKDDNVLAFGFAGGGIAIGFIILTASQRGWLSDSVVDFLCMFFGEFDRHGPNGSIFMKPTRLKQKTT